MKNWYSALAKAPWHDSRLGMSDDFCAGYIGYWAIEAAAFAYLMEFDDRAFRRHLVYPGDLVDFARDMDAHSALEKDASVKKHDRVEGR